MKITSCFPKAAKAVERVSFEHLGLITFLGIVGAFLNWVAKRCRFFSFDPDQTTVSLRYPITAIVLYAALFFFAIPLIIQSLTLVYHPLKTLFNHHLPLLIGMSQVLSIFITTSFIVIFSLLQNRGVMATLWKKDFTLISSLKDLGLGIITVAMSSPIIACFNEIGKLITTFIFQLHPSEQLATKYIRLSESSPYLLSIAIFSIVIAAPILEEFIFRGLIQTFFKSKLGFNRALFLSSLLFAIFHLSPSQGASQFSIIPPLFILGLYLGFLYERQHSLIAPISLHMTFNSISVMRIVLFSS